MCFYDSLNDKPEKFRAIQHDITYLEAGDSYKNKNDDQKRGSR